MDSDEFKREYQALKTGLRFGTVQRKNPQRRAEAPLKERLGKRQFKKQQRLARKIIKAGQIKVEPKE